MERIDISDEVIEFLTRRIDSVPHLEALLLFWDNPKTAWSHADIAARVYVNRDKARAILADLARHGFVAPTKESLEHYCYEAAWDEAQIMQQVATAYRNHLVHIANLIHAKAGSTPAQEFARAFKFKSKD
ncbi:MAG: hypothetical protein RLZZ227_1475 [Pseudomonadota bacterium]|jgi:hypothetical protein